jgi:hypothetical protein
MRRVIVAAAAVTLAIVAGCTDVSTDPEEVVSLEFPPLPAPSVVVGDTLRDTTGAVVPLSARAYNVRGEVIASAPISFTAADPGITIDGEGRVLGDSIRASPSRVVATTAGGLQSAPQQISVVLRPDEVRNPDTKQDTVRPSTSTASRQSQPIRVQVLHRDPEHPADSAVQRYLVRYRITYPSVNPRDANRAHLIDATGRLAQLDTTDSNGIAELRLELGPCGLEVPQVTEPPPSGECRAPITEVDSVEVEVKVDYRPDHPVIGSGLKIILIVFPVTF